VTKDQFLTAVRREPVPYEGNGVSCHLRHVTAGEWAEWEAFKAGHGGDSFAKWLFLRCVCDEGGERLFTDADLAAVDAMPLGVVNDVCGRVQELNGIGGGDDAGKASSTSGPPSSSSAN
jgi:hypothetical protein